MQITIALETNRFTRRYSRGNPASLDVFIEALLICHSRHHPSCAPWCSQMMHRVQCGTHIIIRAAITSKTHQNVECKSWCCEEFAKCSKTLIWRGLGGARAQEGVTSPRNYVCPLQTTMHCPHNYFVVDWSFARKCQSEHTHMHFLKRYWGWFMMMRLFILSKCVIFDIWTKRSLKNNS